MTDMLRRNYNCGAAKVVQFSLLILLLFTPPCCFTLASVTTSKKGYVVYLGDADPALHSDSVKANHHNILSSAVGSLGAAENAMLYSYRNVFNGFSAHLSAEEFSLLSDMPEVISIFESRVSRLHTTHSWEFLGLETRDGSLPKDSLWRKAKFGADVIIGSFDSGVWPESRSYDDIGLGPVPARWKGACVKGEAFGPENCNKKLIGGKFFVKGYAAAVGGIAAVTEAGDFLSVRDSDGHGTHTSSTAAGNFVADVNLYGQANGTAKGGAPHARIAAYKVCWPDLGGTGGCVDTDILAAMDEAIGDGVDIFTLSLGSDPPLPPLFEDAIAIGALHAFQKGITTFCSAGNAGPAPGTVSNTAPWIVTVGASSIDRSFSSDAILGNHQVYHGSSATNKELKQKLFPLVSAGDVGLPGPAGNDSLLCFNGTLDPTKVAGKIVACLRGISARVEKGAVVLEAGGIGMILGNPPVSGNDIVADPHVLPATMVDANDAIEIFSYIADTSSPMAQITPAVTILGIKPAPIMASFSSQGPSTLPTDVLKPDITAPGLNILAAWTPASSATGLPFDNRIVQYNLESGTSMSCPHAAGVGTLLRAKYPNWSPAAIRSAIMTTATQHDNSGQLIRDASAVTATPFNYGAGQINPNAAAHPGLIYDASIYDFKLFLCGLGYNTSSILVLTGETFECPETIPAAVDLNYPSIALSALKGKTVVTRAVTNVGSAKSVYRVAINAPAGIRVSIAPPKLKFKQKGETLSFQVTFTATNVTGEYAFGSYTWTDGHHNVRSPFAVKAV
ncbi:hypothetical protein BDL97_01G205500 [Sphagnum fallax]|nr:hypothetical protein BDL97_01G205500 [Sphagnum fallax]